MSKNIGQKNNERAEYTFVNIAVPIMARIYIYASDITISIFPIPLKYVKVKIPKIVPTIPPATIIIPIL